MAETVKIIARVQYPLGDEKGIEVPYVEARLAVTPEKTRITCLILNEEVEQDIKDYMWNKVPYEGIYSVYLNKNFAGEMFADAVCFVS